MSHWSARYRKSAADHHKAKRPPPSREPLFEGLRSLQPDQEARTSISLTRAKVYGGGCREQTPSGFSKHVPQIATDDQLVARKCPIEAVGTAGVGSRTLVRASPRSWLRIEAPATTPREISSRSVKPRLADHSFMPERTPHDHLR